MPKKCGKIILWGTLFLTGCDLIDHRNYHDPNLKLQKEDYEKLFTPPLLQKAPPPPLSQITTPFKRTPFNP